MPKNPVVKSLWKFNENSPVTKDEAEKKAVDLQHHAPQCTGGERYFKWMGWAFDIGREPYLIEYPQTGTIQRVWGRSADDVRIGLSLGRKVKVVADPFAK